LESLNERKALQKKAGILRKGYGRRGGSVSVGVTGEGTRVKKIGGGEKVVGGGNEIRKRVSCVLGGGVLGKDGNQMEGIAKKREEIEPVGKRG